MFLVLFPESPFYEMALGQSMLVLIVIAGAASIAIVVTAVILNSASAVPATAVVPKLP